MCCDICRACVQTVSNTFVLQHLAETLSAVLLMRHSPESYTNNKSAGYDGITNEMLKYAPNYIIEIILTIHIDTTLPFKYPIIVF